MTSAAAAAKESNSSVFFQTPRSLIIDEQGKTKFSTSQKIETLIEELQQTGPMVASAYLGPSFYAAPPYKLSKQFEGRDIYAWKAGTGRNRDGRANDLMILGAREIEGKGYVFFQICGDITEDRDSYRRTHIPLLRSDPKTYVVSLETFRNDLFDIYPQAKAPPEEKKAKEKTSSEKYLEKLLKLPIDSILDEGEGQAACCKLGQEMFDFYKKETGGFSHSSKAWIKAILDDLSKKSIEHHAQRVVIEKAWSGVVGDSEYRWRPDSIFKHFDWS